MFLKTISDTARGALATTLLTLACLAPRASVWDRNSKISAAETNIDRLPPLTYWTWERAEDLRAIDPAHTAVAYLDKTILIGPGPSAPSFVRSGLPGSDTTIEVTSKPRRQSVTYPSGETLIAVVRIEVHPGTPLTIQVEQEAAAQILSTAATPSIAALQVDFDAVRSQRPFYTGLLRELRRQMPPTLPLSITALASWCSYDDWIADLPVQEAVPMLFRMEPDRRRAAPDAPGLRITEPLCAASVGVSTREPWPEGLAVGNANSSGAAANGPARKRIYVFADRGWRADLISLNNRKLP